MQAARRNSACSRATTNRTSGSCRCRPHFGSSRTRVAYFARPGPPGRAFFRSPIMRTNLITGIGIAAIAGGVLAAEVAGVKSDDKASVGGKELMLNGAGVRTRAVFKVYVGSLYLPAKAATASAALAAGPRRVQLNLLRNLSADQLVDALIDGLKENTSDAEFTSLKPQTDQLVA